MRRLLGEPPPPKSPPPPPVIPGAQRPPPLADPRQPDAEELRSRQTWQEEAEEGWAEDGEQPRPTPLPMRPPLVSQSPVGVTVPTEAQAQAARRFAQLNEAGQHPATVVHGGDSRLHACARAAYWRNPQNARQAFVASLVFGPPKGLEP